MRRTPVLGGKVKPPFIVFRIFPPWDILLNERILSYGSIHSICVVAQSISSKLDHQIQALPLITFGMLLSLLSLLTYKIDKETITISTL